MSKKSTKKSITSICIVVGVIAAICAGLYFYGAGNVFSVEEPTYIYIDQDDDVDSLRTKIEQNGNPRTMIGFDILSKVYRMNLCIHTGRYAIDNDKSMKDIVMNVRRHEQDPIGLVVPSTRTMPAMAGKLANMLMVDSASIAQALTDSDAISSLGYTKENIYCMFVPNTYEVNWDISVDKLLARLDKEKKTFWTEDRIAKAKAQGLTPDQAVTLASIVESETANDGEKPTIAGLYLNRLKKDMLLQSDPTVIFAMGDFTIRRVLGEYLKKDSPYNTYKYKGLPPGPIKVPSIVGIDAVLNPAKHEYLYMCAKEDFSGTHNFAVTFAEHQANAKKYINALNERQIYK